MRKAVAILVLVLTTILIFLLNRPMGALPALGKLLDPVNGFWANAESVNTSFDGDIKLHTQAQVSVSFDDRLVPHIYANNDNDLYYVQGYVHAYFRLWQMDMQTRAAGGRVSEVIGEKGLKFDRTQRRKGMVYGAQNSLKVMEEDARTHNMLDAYTQGVNDYINSLNDRKLPLEYKLMGFKPEPWTNLKCALLLKYMADDLTGYTEDIPMTVIRGMLDEATFNNLFPERDNESTPVIPAGTVHSKPSLNAHVPVADSMMRIQLSATDFDKEDNEGKGSNNWAVSGSRTQSGAPILCNDPHLGLNLPSLWFEVQLHAPGINTYGVSLPGAPGIVIGFNDNISWGFTNNYRDVKDFYAIDQHGDNYAFNGRQLAFVKQAEHIKIKGKPEFVDTVNYTLHGPVIYDDRFHGPGGIKIPLALKWMAHRGTNELLSLYMLNRSKTYDEFVAAILHFECPAQNMIYADKEGRIALWGQGQFVNKWKGQGKYIMKGTDSTTIWQEMIPMLENPHATNPPQGFLSSANQTVTDSTYPYWYNGYFYQFRGWRINQLLSATHQATVQDMFAMQNDDYSMLASVALPVMLKHLQSASEEDKNKYLNSLRQWQYRLSANSTAATTFQIWWSMLYNDIWKKQFQNIPDNLRPSDERTMQLLRDSAITDVDNLVAQSFRETVDSIGRIKGGKREWYQVKNTTINHLTKIPAFSFTELPTGGWRNAINAMKGNHGPSWRMVVQMGKEPEAYGVYPGGQSGNPGSKYYATFLNKWVKGEYYRLSFVPNGQSAKEAKLPFTWNIQPE
ncbi:MAG: penicillin acylase family protein [Sphingobacteriales bacterium]|nr:MAG: penicillin acylase family protein [Sphingobacteriales bacterium]